jgi:hypothetical protein
MSRLPVEFLLQIFLTASLKTLMRGPHHINHPCDQYMSMMERGCCEHAKFVVHTVCSSLLMAQPGTGTSTLVGNRTLAKLWPYQQSSGL